MIRARARARAAALAVVLAFAQRAHAQSPPAADVTATLARIEHARADVRTLEADFDEERTMGLFAQTLHASGHLAVMTPDKLRWETVAPDPGVFVVDGARVAYRAGGGSASAGRSQLGPFGAMQGDLATFMGGHLGSLGARYTISASAGDAGAVVLTVVPREAAVARVLARVTLTFAPDLRSLTRIALDEPGGDRAVVTLRNVRVNTAHVTASLFAAP